MKNILLPTDFSDNAYNAIAYALSLFEEEECNFYILNAYQTGASNVVGWMNKQRDTRLFRAVKEQAKNELSQLEHRIIAASKNPKHHFQFLAVADSLLNAIGKTVIGKDVDYIFMGTQGASGLKEIFLGSNTVRIIKKIDFCPIVAVPANYSFKSSNEIILVTGYEHNYEKYELMPLLNIAKLRDSKITAVHVDKDQKLTKHQETARDLLEKRLKGARHEFLELTDSPKISAAIGKLVDENEDIGMIAIIDYWHSFLEKITHEAVVNKIAFSAKVPLLVMHLVE